MRISFDSKLKKNSDMACYLLLLIYAVLVMLLCAGSSPFIQYLSPDSSIFYTMGRSAQKGTVLYKEIADHKGFYLFLFNWIGAAITPNSMNGLFLVEVFFAWVKLVFVYKIARFFLESRKQCMLSAILFLAVSSNFLSWNTGNLGEQFALAFWLISLYYMTCYLEKNKKTGEITEHKPHYMFIHGVCACIVLFIQANLIAMWIPFGIGLAVILLKEKKVSNFFKNLAALLSGIGVTALPVVLYGIVNHCMEDMYYVMFEINFLYSADGRIGKSIGMYIKEFFFQPSVFIVILAAIGVWIACRHYKERYFSWIFTGMFLFSLLCMSVSLNANPIYYTTYMPFMVPCMIKIAGVSKDRIFVLECVAVLAVTVVCNMQLVKKYLRIGTSVYAYESAWQMEELIADKDAKTLVLGNSLYYNCTGTLPHIKYFTIFGSGLRYETFPYCVDEQQASLLSGENEYVIIQFKNDEYSFWENKERDGKMKECLDTQYDCILEYREGGIHSALYRKKQGSL